MNFIFLSLFIGSSTDLTPSVIGYYDRLSGSFNGDKLIGEIQQDSLEKDVVAVKNFSKEQSPKPKLIVSKIPTKPTAIATSINNKSITSSLPKINSNFLTHHQPSTKTLQIISPNVHRMISSHQTTAETITNSYLLNNNSNNLHRGSSQSLQVNKRQIGSDKSINLPLSSQRRIFGNKFTGSGNKPTGIALPLSKNLSKFSQSNGNLVDSIEEPIVHTITDNNCSNEEIYSKTELIVDSEKTPTNCDHNFNYDNINYNDDDDDNIQKVLNKTSELINNLLSGGNNDSNSKSLDIHENNLNNNNNNNNNATTNSISRVQSINNEVNRDNDEMSRHKYKLHANSTDTDGEEDRRSKLNEANNLNLNTFAKSLDNVTEIDTKQHLQIQQQPPPTASPKLTYSRAKLLSHQQTTLTSPNQSPKLANKNIAVDVTVVNTASDGKLNASPSTKHRPLSAASISSSSSSTSTVSSSNSFGNEHLTNANRQYLASIESLADHSENEVNPSLTMCERAVLEIIDSERSFVADLGQIIRGYFTYLIALKID